LRYAPPPSGVERVVGQHFQDQTTELAASLAARRDPADRASAIIVDRRRVAAGGLAADHLAARVVVRRRAAAIGRGPSGGTTRRFVERALLRRRCAGHHRECQQYQQDAIGHRSHHPVHRRILHRYSGQIIASAVRDTNEDTSATSH
jgi:hypothetical protein